MKLSKDFTWYVEHSKTLRRYAGKHVAVVDDRIVGVGKSAKEAYDQAKREQPKKSPLLVYVPKGETLVL